MRYDASPSARGHGPGPGHTLWATLRGVVVAAGALAALAGAAALPVQAAPPIGAVPIVDGLDQPLYATHAPGRPNDLFVVERGGAVRIVDLLTRTVSATPFLNIPNVDTRGEGGLTAIAFDPDYASNGFVYTMHTAVGDGSSPMVSHVRRYRVLPGNPDQVSPLFTRVLSFDQPQTNHNGGWLGFGPVDGLLYITTGDGGGANDTGIGHTPGIGNAQDLTDNLLGKVLRIDVRSDDFPGDATRNYAIPASNPFVGVDGDDEIWAYGLRNPFRASFDRLTGDFYIADVGQNAREEIDFQSAASPGGVNYGWRLREGTIPTPIVGGPRPPGAIDPIYDYAHGNGDFEGSSVIGGYLYRGPVTWLQGLYVFADFISDHVWAFDPADPAGTIVLLDDALTPGIGAIDNIAGFGEDAAGHLYMTSLNGSVVLLVPEPATVLMWLAGLAGLGAWRRRVRAPGCR